MGRCAGVLEVEVKADIVVIWGEGMKLEMNLSRGPSVIVGGGEKNAKTWCRHVPSVLYLVSQLSYLKITFYKAICV